jgi:cation transport ATPase
MLAFAEATSGPEYAPAFLDRWRPWIALALALIVVAYAPTVLRLATMTSFAVPGMRVW